MRDQYHQSLFMHLLGDRLFHLQITVLDAT
jgi:hypothetical protein